MTSKEMIGRKSLAILLTSALMLISAQAAWAAPIVQQNGKLVTTGNQAISVNGNSMNGGGTILSGATLETPPGVGATINLGPLGSVDLAPGTKAILEFSSDGTIRLKIIQGCAIVNSKKGTEGIIQTEQGAEITKNDKAQGGVLDVCVPPGGGPAVVNQGAAANAGAGAGGGGVGGGTAGAGSEGLNKALLAVILGGGVAAPVIAFLIANDNDNPSEQ